VLVNAALLERFRAAPRPAVADLLAVMIAASLLPARRAASINPVDTLRRDSPRLPVDDVEVADLRKAASVAGSDTMIERDSRGGHQQIVRADRLPARTQVGGHDRMRARTRDRTE